MTEREAFEAWRRANIETTWKSNGSELWAAWQAALAAQPEPVAWRSTDTKPPESVPVWLFEDGRIWIGTYEYDSDGWCFTNAYGHQFYGETGWQSPDAEWDDDYKPTHWMPLPEPPGAAAPPVRTLTDEEIDCIPFDGYGDEDLGDGVALRKFARAIEAAVRKP